MLANLRLLPRAGATVAGLAVAALLFAPTSASAQDRDRDWDGARYTRLQPGMTIPVRTTEPIDTSRTDYRVFTGVIAEDVIGGNGRIAIPRGSTVELMVRRNRDNKLSLDLESVVANGQRYAVNTSPDRVVGTAGYDNPVGAIVGAIAGASGADIHIPRDTVINFRLESPLDINVSDRGVDRDGYHYHDYYGDRDRR